MPLIRIVSAPSRRLAPRSAALGLLCALVATACSDGATSPLEEVQRLQDAGSHEAAVELLRPHLAEHPDDREASFRLGLSLIALGRGNEAVFPLRRAAESPELGKQANLVLAGTLLSTRNYDAAIEAADKVLAVEPENQAALVARARGALGASEPEIALASIDALEKLKPGGMLPKTLRAEALGLIPERLAEAEKLYDELEHADWGDDENGPGRSCLDHARLVHDRAEDPARAGALAVGCAERYADQTRVLIGAAGFLDRLDRVDEATQLVRAQFEKDPSNLELRSALAQRLIADDEFAEAEQLVIEEAEKQNKAAGWSALAGLRRRLRNNDGALAALDRALSVATDEEKEDLHADRADLLLDMDRVPDAEAELEKIESAVYRNILEGRLAEKRGDRELALEKLGAALQQWPDNWSVRVIAARLAFELGDDDRALEELREITRHAPKETDAALQMAQIYLARGAFQDAHAFAWRHIRERGAAGPEGHLVAARAASAARMHEEVNKALQDLGARSDGKFAQVALAEHARIVAMNQGPAKALEALDGGIARTKLDLGKPENAPALRQAVGLAAETGDVGGALRRVDAVLAKAGERADLRALRAYVLAGAGRRDEALREAERAVADDAKNGFAQFVLGIARRESGDAKGAVECFDRALALDPTLSDAGYLAAQTQLASGDAAGGRARLERVVRTYPDHAGALNDLAWLLAESGQELERAALLAQQAVRFGGRAEMFDTFGYVRLKQERFEEAARAFKLALERNGGYATARYHLALALDGSGDRAAALAELKQAVNAPAFPELEAARTELARLEAAPVSKPQ